jgi:hypothetical protein
MKKDEEVMWSLATKMVVRGVRSQELATSDFPPAEGLYLIQAIKGCSGGGAPPSTSGSRGLGCIFFLLTGSICKKRTLISLPFPAKEEEK